MKLLVLSNYFPEKCGGIEFVADNLVQRFRMAGCQARWVAADLLSHPHVGHADDVPLTVCNFTEEKLGFPYPLPRLRSVKGLRELVAWCDVVHLHDALYAANQWVYGMARRLRKPVVTTQHVALVRYQRGYKNLLQQFAHRTLGRRVLAGSDQVTFVSAVVKTWFETFVRFRRPPLIIPNGVDTELFHPVDVAERAETRAQLQVAEGQPLLVFVGRFTQKKGLHLIREAACRQVNWNWLLIGQGAEETPSTWGLPNVRVLRPQSQVNLRQYYGAADLLVLPSVGEGLPLVVLEAMACGTPSVAGVETVEALPGLSQYVCATPPNGAGLMAVLERLLGDPAAVASLRQGARQFAEQRTERVGIEIVHEMHARRAAQETEAGQRVSRELRQRLPAQARTAGAQEHDVGRARFQPARSLGDLGEVALLGRKPHEAQAAVTVARAQSVERSVAALESIAQVGIRDAVRADRSFGCELDGLEKWHRRSTVQINSDK